MKTKAQVDFVDANDGTFWIAMKDYYNFFYVTTICFEDQKNIDTVSTTVVDTHDEG